MTQNITVDQHTVSQVVLRTFRPRGGRSLRVFDRTTGRANLRSPRSTFLTPNFVVHEADAAEMRWGAIESKLPLAYEAIRKGTALDQPRVIGLLKDLLALHWVRSTGTRLVHQRVCDDVIAESKRRYANRPDLLDAVFRSRFGLDPAGPESRAMILDQLHSNAPQLFDEQWSESLARNFRNARDYFESQSVEIVHSPDQDLIIGDVPVITPKAGHAGVAVHQQRGPDGGKSDIHADQPAHPDRPRTDRAGRNNHQRPGHAPQCAPGRHL